MKPIKLTKEQLNALIDEIGAYADFRSSMMFYSCKKMRGWKSKYDVFLKSATESAIKIKRLFEVTE